MLGFLKGFASKGVAMIILQILRACTIIGLLSTMPACWILAIKVDMHKPYFVFDAASLVFMSGIALFLILSELPFGKKFFMHHWPAFSQHSGLGWLAIALLMIGCNTIGQLNNANTEPKKIGMPWWQLVMASGILNLVFGVLNGIATWAFHDYREGRNVRQIRSRGADSVDGSLPYAEASDFSYKTDLEEPKPTFAGRMSKMFAKSNSSKDQSRPIISHPISAHPIEHNDRSDSDALNMPSVPMSSRLSEENDNDYNGGQRSPIDPSRIAPRQSSHPALRPPGPGVRAPSSIYSAADPAKIYGF